MTDAEFVIAGWVITGLAALIYWIRLERKIRRAEQLDLDA